MNIILILGVIVECIVLLLLTVFKKWTKKVFIVVAVITGICCVCVGGVNIQRRKTESNTDQRSGLYMSARLIQEGYYAESLEALSSVSEKNCTAYGGRPVRALAYNLNGVYETAKAYLEQGENQEVEQRLLEMSIEKKPADKELQVLVTEATLEKIAATEREARQWEVEMKVRFMGFQLSEDERGELDSKLAAVKAAISDNQCEEAYRLMTADDSDTDVKNAVIVSNMYVKNYNCRVMSDTDQEYARLWKAATDMQAELNLAAVAIPKGDTSGKEYQEYLKARARYTLATTDLTREAVKRAIKYLISMEPVRQEDEIGYQLQLARLYCMSGQMEEARACINNIFVSNDLNDSKWLGREAAAFREACIIYISNPLADECGVLFDGMMEGLYQSLFDDEGLGTFQEFVMSCMKETFGGLIIKRVDAASFPQIIAELSVTKDGLEIDDGTLSVMDTGINVSHFSVEKKEVHDLSLSLVLDRSGSMKGDKLAESKSAIRNCIAQLSDGASVSFVTFENDAALECGLTESKYLVMNLVDGVKASGGTNIASGLSMAIDSLKVSLGTKAIILLSDGHDNAESKARINSVLAEATANQITVYTIGLEGCDESYLQNISSQTGGQFIMVNNVAELNSIYQEIQNAVMNNYVITYEAEGDEASRTLIVKGKSSSAEARKYYSTEEIVEEERQMNDGIQEASYYKQIGGTGSGR